jgi:hypothetical protein
VTGLKHLLVRLNAYPAYAALRPGHRTLVKVGRVFGFGRLHRHRRVVPAAIADPPPAESTADPAPEATPPPQPTPLRVLP